MSFGAIKLTKSSKEELNKEQEDMLQRKDNNKLLHRVEAECSVEVECSVVVIDNKLFNNSHKAVFNQLLNH